MSVTLQDRSFNLLVTLQKNLGSPKVIRIHPLGAMNVQ